ncbi:MAG TPA: DNA polymerase III subunit delta [Bacteroidales bacterium]|nr:DNA polymerase III subunit delta [Bacteroidales bacterium]
MKVTVNQLFKDLKAHKYQPVYLIHGEEPYYIDLVTDFVEQNILASPEKEFNQVIVYGRDVNTQQVVNQCKAYPMMGNLQVVILREAQDMDLRKGENYKPMLAYMQSSSPHTMLVIGFKYKKPPAEWIKYADKAANCTLVESPKLADYKLNEWIAERVKEQGYSITSKACNMLSEFLGNDLEKIVNELGKLFINHDKEKPISENIIEKYIGISKDYNSFELINAIAARDVSKAHRIVFHFADNPKENPIFKIIPILQGFFTKILLYHSLPDKGHGNPEKALRVYSGALQQYVNASRLYSPGQCIKAISLLRTYAARAVGIENSSTETPELLKELVFRIMN